MSAAAETIAAIRDTGILIIADHASAHVPGDIDLGIDPALLATHIAIDIGVAPLAAVLCGAIGCGAVLATVSRLVCDLNREAAADGVVPVTSDGVRVPGNAIGEAGRRARIERFHAPYHAAVSAAIAAARAALLVSLHSFTPRLATRPEEARPWQVGVLYNRDDRAARAALPRLAAAGIVAGDNQPYSGEVLNATMNRHAEAAGIPYLGLEVRQDLIADAAGVARWGAALAPLIVSVRDTLAAAAP